MAGVYVMAGMEGLGGIVECQISGGVQELVQGSGGDVDPTWASLIDEAPEINVNTVHVSTALGTYKFLTGAALSGLDFWFQALEAGAVRDADGFVKMTGYKGIGVPGAINVSQGGEAVLPLRFVLTGDASNEPLTAAVATTGVAATGVTEKFTLGPVSLNTTDIEVQDATIDPRHELEVHRDSGIAYPTHVSVIGRQPMFSFTTRDLSKWATIKASGKSGLKVTGCEVYLRALDAGGTVVADGTASHIKFACTEGVAYVGDGGGGHGAAGSMRVTVFPTDDGTNDIVQVSRNVAIT